MYKIKLEKFEGPLDLLLYLIEEQKMSITEISLSVVADQYLAYLASSPEINLEELADFLVVAAKLIYIKSKVLLPELHLEDDIESRDLERQLKILRIYLDASKVVSRLIAQKRFTYIRERHLRIFEPMFSPPKHLTTLRLKALMLEVIAQIEPIVSLPQDVITKTISIQDKINQIRRDLVTKAAMSFSNLLSHAKSKTEVVVTFLALLELIKQRTIIVTQSKTFDDITIEQVKASI